MCLCPFLSFWLHVWIQIRSAVLPELQVKCNQEEGKKPVSCVSSSPSAVTLSACACLHECFSDCICLTSYVLAQLCCDLLAAHQDHFSLALA